MSHTEHYDIIIIGAGPAGSCTAIYADPERSGRRVLLLESKKVVGTPMQCGEAIPTYEELLTIFPEADCPELYALPEDIYSGSIEGIKFKSPTGRRYVADLKGQMFDRERLDQYLFHQAVDRGVEYRLGCRVKNITGKAVETTQGTFEGEIIIGADGVYSTVAEAFPAFAANRDICPCALVLARGRFDADLIELWFESRFPGGYFWLFPKNKIGEANIGLGVRGPRQIRALLEQVLTEIRAEYDLEVFEKGGGAVPLGGLKSRIVHEHVALVGDAAGMVFPTNGGGTGLAMMGGKWLGRILAEGKPLSDFQKKVDAFMAPVLKSSLRTRRQMDFVRRNQTVFSTLMWFANLKGWRNFIIG